MYLLVTIVISNILYIAKQDNERFIYYWFFISPSICTRIGRNGVPWRLAPFYNIKYFYIYIHNYNILCIIKVFEYWQARETPGYLTHISNKCVRQQKDTASWHQVQLCFHSQSCALSWTKDKVSECSLLSPFALLAFFAFPVIRTCALRYECVAPRAKC